MSRELGIDGWGMLTSEPPKYAPMPTEVIIFAKLTKLVGSVYGKL